MQIDQTVHKFLRRLPRRDVARLLVVLNSLPQDPFRGDIQKMQGEENVWRRRVGAYRIRYELIPQGKAIYVFLVERRTSATY
ncbi:MAG: hypothetical protein A3C11_01345 [Candidatus Sungbacteria bacterium RIFCSPHIGHO2_02_FULL_49_12]|uniref:Plasmid stabilization protein n=1 Tax=Candidatus Sungbacteria bacterium RIFCSPHIGHO2_02_FULL_49_12 TaxID=1802271 RepID=A0A1G2KN96_9BACT|nr:MAG: hypothetical protein A3C11_01345 [Candidatus Sungbacteria bacterium RIFCSPHIGHO2_02_FULL_49_12]